ncbi:glycosyltransferase [Sphingomonas sp. T9W2]|uniref:glycosyltransferase n=1 Tax=Sphingomonas sp. T9W2 TaxID=3143183 RepID=UPI0031F49315
MSSPRLRIWLFNPYGPLPGEGWREYSYVTIGSALAAAGHDVIWWTSNFSHHFKTFRSGDWEDRILSSGLVLRLVPTPGYRRNISPGRFWRDIVFGWRAYRRARTLPPPDVVLTSEPATMGGLAGVRLATKTGATLLYDQMDLWPELMVQSLPPRARPIGHLLFAPIYRIRRTMFGKLDGAMALAKPYLTSILDELPVNRSIPSLVVYNGIDVPTFRRVMQQPLPDAMALAFDGPGLKAIFAGSLGPSYDVGPMIDAASAMERAGSDTTIYIAGDGPERPKIEAAAARCANLVYLGKLAPDMLPRVYGRCDVGLSCYSASSNVEMCDKFYDYTAAGLIVVNSLQGEVRDWIEGSGLGMQYRAGDAASLTQALVAIEKDPEQAAQLRQASWNIGMQFNKDTQHARLVPWIEMVTANVTSRQG